MMGKSTDLAWRLAAAIAMAIVLLLHPITDLGSSADALAATPAMTIQADCVGPSGEWLTDGDDCEASSPDSGEKAADCFDGIASFATLLPAPARCRDAITETAHVSTTCCGFDRPPERL